MSDRADPILVDAQWLGGSRVLLGASLRSGQGTADERLREVVEQGITHILDCRSEAHDRYLIEDHALAVAYLRCTIDPTSSAGISDWLARGVPLARQALAPADAMLFVHCSNGQTRGPSMAFAILLDQGWSAGDALALLLTRRRKARAEYAEIALALHLDRIAAGARVRDEALQMLTRVRAELRPGPR